MYKYINQQIYVYLGMICGGPFVYLCYAIIENAL